MLGLRLVEGLLIKQEVYVRALDPGMMTAWLIRINQVHEQQDAETFAAWKADALKCRWRLSSRLLSH